MKPRDRQALSGAATGAPASAPTAAQTNGNGATSLVWEDWYRAATPAQQAELLALAGRQGFLYAQQIPPPAPTTRETTGTPVEPATATTILGDVLAGKTTLDPLQRTAAPPVIDTALDLLQREAVARALTTPDVCLIQGLPGAGKTRVVLEILTQAAQQGRRVLFLAQHASNVDRVLERLADRPGLLPIRLAAAGETVAPALRPMLLPERKQGFRMQALEKARLAKEKMEEQCRGRHREEENWPNLVDLARQIEKLHDDQHTARHKLGSIAAEAEQDAQAGRLDDAFRTLTASYEQDRDACEVESREVAAKSQTTREQLDSLTREMEPIEPFAQAKAKGAWWSLAWWKATLSSALLARKAELDKLAGEARDRLADLQRQANELATKRKNLDEEFQSKRARLLDDEVASRRRTHEEHLARFDTDLRETETRWHALVERLDLTAALNGNRSLAAIEAAKQSWQVRKTKDEKNCQFAQQWVTFLEESGEGLSARLPSLAGIVAGTVSAWSHEGAAFPDPFDLLVVEEADQIAEAQLLPLARKANRWVLVANYLTAPTAFEAAPANARELRAAKPRTGVFQRLWQMLHREPSGLPYTWSIDNHRLVCQLRPVAPQDRARVESERLADAPDIELRILTLPRCEPVLVQVSFPIETPLVRAKEFIYRELQELALQTAGRNGWLDEQADNFVWHFMPAPLGQTDCVSLETGLCEWVGQGQTYRLEFARSHWNRTQALGWVESHLKLRDLGRTMFLQVPHRMQPNLAPLIGDVLFPGTVLDGCHAPRDIVATAFGAGLAFLAVPEGNKDSDKVKKTPVRDSLEIDLSASRFGDRIPGDLSAGLPRHGFANLLEAQAVVKTLEKLQNDGRVCCNVLAFYQGQVELIRRLLAKSAALAGCDIEVGLPGQFRDRECPVLVVSLTRSNFLRSGHFSPEPLDPFLALTRAQDQLILVGDPGTLIRWSQSQDADGADNGRERHWVRQLARYLQGKGSYQAAFYLCESSS